MKEINNGNYSCEEIINLLNEMVDGDIDPDRLKLAEDLIEKNPECRCLYQTLLKTIELYQIRKKEMEKVRKPELNWTELGKKSNQK